MHVSDVCAVSCWGVLSMCELRSLLILFFASYLNLVTVSQQVLAFLWLRHSPSDLTKVTRIHREPWDGNPHRLRACPLSRTGPVCAAVFACLLTAVSEMQLIYAELSGLFPECQKRGRRGKGLEQ